MKIQDALDLHLKEEASRIIGENQNGRIFSVFAAQIPGALARLRRMNHGPEGPFLRVREQLRLHDGLLGTM